jgi:tetratricopeptide (TPR) repeat protein
MKGHAPLRPHYLSCAVLFCFVALSVTGLNAQDRDAEVAELQKKIKQLVEAGRYDEAIESGKRVAEIENRTGNALAYGSALMEVARLRKRSILHSKPPATKQYLFYLEREEKQRRFIFDLREAVKVFRSVEAPKLLSTAQTELAVALLQASPSQQDIKEATDLMQSSAEISEREEGLRSETTLNNLWILVDIHTQTARFERSLPILERMVPAAMAKWGDTNKRLLPVLKTYAGTLVAVGQHEKAVEIAKYVNRIEGTNAFSPGNFPRLAMRSKGRIEQSIGRDRNRPGPSLYSTSGVGISSGGNTALPDSTRIGVAGGSEVITTTASKNRTSTTELIVEIVVNEMGRVESVNFH